MQTKAIKMIYLAWPTTSWPISKSTHLTHLSVSSRNLSFSDPPQLLNLF